MVEHQAAIISDGNGEDYHLRGGYEPRYPKNKALATALRAKGLSNPLKPRVCKHQTIHGCPPPVMAQVLGIHPQTLPQIAASASIHPSFKESRDYRWSRPQH